MHSYLFVFFFGQSKGKADKFHCIINMLDVLRESLILVSLRIDLRDFNPLPVLLRVTPAECYKK